VLEESLVRGVGRAKDKSAREEREEKREGGGSGPSTPPLPPPFSFFDFELT